MRYQCKGLIPRRRRRKNKYTVCQKKTVANRLFAGAKRLLRAPSSEAASTILNVGLDKTKYYTAHSGVAKEDGVRDIDLLAASLLGARSRRFAPANSRFATRFFWHTVYKFLRLRRREIELEGKKRHRNRSCERL